jgi:ATP-dependent Clp protease protease subunit
MNMPYIVRTTKTGKEQSDAISYAFSDKREIYLFDEIDNAVCESVIAQLGYLDDVGEDDIKLIINSPGGSVNAGLAIVDAMKRCKCDVSTICTGMAASMAAVILSCGTVGKRYATPFCEVMIHQPLGGVQGQATDIELVSKHIRKVKDKINKLLSDNTQKPVDVIAADCERDYYMSADEAIDYGIVDDYYQ